MMEILIAFVLGLIAGLVSKGITISHHHYEKIQKKEEIKYNESMKHMLPNEVQEYYHKTNGMNKF